MLASAASATPWGIEARLIRVEVDVRNGLPQMQIVGLPDTAVRESRQRVRAAIKNCGFDLAPRAVVVNLAPADLRKEGNHLDLAIALALLAAHGEIPQERLDGRMFCGELGLDGSIRAIRGGLAIAHLGQRVGMEEVLVPHSTAVEAAEIRGVRVVAPPGLGHAIEHLTGAITLPATEPPASADGDTPAGPDLSEVRGQETAKRALEIAAAGGHNLLLIGPPGSGKTMLARRLPGLLPPLTPVEAMEVAKVHSLVAAGSVSGLARERPFRSPHHGVSTAAMTGGGNPPRPGEVSLAHRGVLFLDELPEFRRDTLEALRQPLEEGQVTVVRVRYRFRFPARFALLAAMNPCPCGHLGDTRHGCRCSEREIERYRRRVSGPLLDRIDLHVEVPAVSLEELKAGSGETSGAVAERVRQARSLQEARLGREGHAPLNATISQKRLERHCRLRPAAQHLLDAAFERLSLSARALHRTLKVARTIADLAGDDQISTPHVAEAIQYRALDRRGEGA